MPLFSAFTEGLPAVTDPGTGDAIPLVRAGADYSVDPTFFTGGGSVSITAYTLTDANVTYPIVSDRFTVVLTGNPDGGTFTIATAIGDLVLDWNEDAAGAQAVIDAIPTDALVVSGGPLPNVALVFEYRASQAGQDFTPTAELTDNSLTGGTSPDVTITKTQYGHQQTWALFQPAVGDVIADVQVYTTVAWDGSFSLLPGYFPSVPRRGSEYTNLFDDWPGYSGDDYLDVDGGTANVGGAAHLTGKGFNHYSLLGTIMDASAVSAFRPVWTSATIPFMLGLDQGDGTPADGETVVVVELWTPTVGAVL